MKFCGQCGAVVDSVAPAPRAEVSPESSTAERRQITVLFCDLVGSTDLAEQLDPEQLREVVHDYQVLAGRVIDRFDGHIAQYLGDGILVYFGYPLAHEDDARRAVHSGLGVTHELVQLSETLAAEHDVTLAVRVGIHTGLVVAGEVGTGERRERLALGHTPNVAARLQGLAGRNEVLLTEETYQLLRDEFVCEPLREQSVKGVSRSLTVYRALRTRPPARVDAGDGNTLTPPVGREHELNALCQAFAGIASGRGAAVLVTGEAGVGKSRLVRMFHDAVGDDRGRWLTWRCAAYFQRSPLYPVIEFFQSVLGGDAVTPEERFEALEQQLTTLGRPLGETVPLIATLIELPLPERYRPPELAPQLLRAKTHAALLQMLTGMTSERPVILVIEDLHWADPSTLELLEFILQHGSQRRLLLLLTARPRPAFEPHWDAKTVEEIVLDPLSEAHARSMVTGVCAGKTLPLDVMSEIVAKTDGVPLFVEEFTKMLLESGRLTEHADRYELDGPLPSSAIPTTIKDSLLARLDQVATVKPVIQWGAVLGRAFSFKLIQAVSGRASDQLWEDLQRLVQVGLLFQRGTRPQAEFTFKHALIQEAAYEMLLKRTRRARHRQAADVLHERFPEVAEVQPELVARHYTEARLSEPAVDYWLRAAQKAVARSAHVEAAEIFRNIGSELERLPEGLERDRRELKLQTLRAATLSVRHGYIGRELQVAYDRARELSKRLEGEPQSVAVLAGLAGFYIVRGELAKSHEIGFELIEAAEKRGDPRSLLDAHRYVALALHLEGSHLASREHSLKALAAAANIDPTTETPFASGVVLEEGRVNVRATYSTLLWALGYWDQAQAFNDEAVVLAHEINHPYSVTFAHYLASWLYQLLRRPDEVNRHAQQVVALSEQHGFFLTVLGSLNLLWSQVQLSKRAGADVEALREQLGNFRQGWDAYLASGARVSEIYFTSLLIECHLLLGQDDEAWELLEHCFTVIGASGDQWEADLNRLKGEMLLARAATRQRGQDALRDQAEACFRTAVDIATAQSAKALELRAATSLARLTAARGERAAARDLLAPVCDWFQEGHNQPELRAANALLRELG